jgi:hypothetical protein
LGQWIIDRFFSAQHRAVRAGCHTFAARRFRTVEFNTLNMALRRDCSSSGRLLVLDADNGKTYDVRCENVAQEEITIGAARITCNHFRLQGAVDVELWFDAAGYLVRQVGTEDGHATELRLVSVQQLALGKSPR